MPGNRVVTTVATVGLSEVVSDFEGLKAAGTGTAVYKVGTHVEYAVHLEFGTSRMPPYPFMRPAVQDLMGSGVGDKLADHASNVDHLVQLIAMWLESRMKHYASTGVPPGPNVRTGNLKGSIRAQRV